ncbi:glycosyltransferase family 2 protein [Microcoleus sp. D2_18a_B4]|uniref:glycosyltransferase family 2 protein n=1 Tax=Microcoleus sp. D2_18a_B4 TaxID=3055329 RepID=UPI002FD0CF3F
MVSVIIPTHNRSSSLRRALDALHSQTYPIDLIEVIVVADSCIDDTLAMLQDYKAPFKLHAIEVNCRSAAIARNTGAASATGQLLLFLDDDIEALPPLVESHVRAHRERPGSAVMGPYPPKLHGGTRLFDVEVRSWWEDKFYQMSQPGHRFTYKDLLSGNLSLDAELFARLDGFDSAFGNCGGEDYEFGVRLLKADVPFVVAAEAVGYHYEHETNNLDRSFRRFRQEGRSDVLIGQRHPELRPILQVAAYETACSLVDKILVAVTFFWPAAVDLLALGLRKSLDLLESLRMRGTWRWLRAKLRAYWYLRGVLDELKSRSAISTFIQGGRAGADLGGHEINIDLEPGWEAAESLLDAERPAGVYLYYGQLTVGHILPQAGAEPLRGAHLRSILALHFAEPLGRAMAINGMPPKAETLEEKPLVAFKNYELAINKYVGDFKLKTSTSKVGKLENWEIATQNSQLKTQNFSL